MSYKFPEHREYNCPWKNPSEWDKEFYNKVKNFENWLQWEIDNPTPASLEYRKRDRRNDNNIPE